MRVLSTKVDNETYQLFTEKADVRGSYPSLLLRDLIYRFIQGSGKVAKEDQNQLRAGDKKFDMVINKLEKVSDDMAKIHAELVVTNKKLETLIAQRGEF